MRRRLGKRTLKQETHPALSPNRKEKKKEKWFADLCLPGARLSREKERAREVLEQRGPIRHLFQDSSFRGLPMKGHPLYRRYQRAVDFHAFNVQRML